MYINKSSRGIGWYSVVNKTYAGEKMERGEYLNFVFKKGCEPNDETIEGDLFFVDSYGNKRLVLPYVDCYNGRREIKLRLMDVLHRADDFKPKEDNSKMGGYASESGKSVNIEQSELPFY